MFNQYPFAQHSKQPYVNIVLNKIVYCAVDNECKKIYCADCNLKGEEIPELYRHNLEGETRVMSHAKHADLHDPGNIVSRAKCHLRK